MPSSLIIVALAVAWLVVLVPMVARKRQEVAQTGDDALASRVVRGERGDREEDGMPEAADSAYDEDEYADEAYDDGFDEVEPEQVEEPVAEYDDYAEPPSRAARDEQGGRYRPGRGGFDPQAAELAARAKYAFRQRVVVALLATMIISAVLAGVLFSTLFWLTGLAAAGLVGYLGYLRRQVRIENEIRQRRMARMAGARSAERRRERDDELDVQYDRRIERDFDAEYDAKYEADYEHEYELADDGPMTLAGVERKPRPSPRAPRRNTVVVDVDDEDPAFHELAEPDHPTYRRAVGE